MADSGYFPGIVPKRTAIKKLLLFLRDTLVAKARVEP